jgi:DNA-binding beta-propeller fold protein YncE
MLRGVHHLLFALLLIIGLVSPMVLAETAPVILPETTPPARNASSIPETARGKKAEFTTDVVTVLTKDDHGENLRMPQALFFDRGADELYLINGGDNRIVVYGPDYFPQESLGKGRGIDTPVAGYVDDKGRLYIPQASTSSRPPRLTILNSAFLPVKEIDLAGFPDIGDFSPQKIAMGRDGKIYLTGVESSRILVLRGDGGFVRWFEVTIDKKSGDYLADDGSGAAMKTVIKNVVADSVGNLYFLSEESSKVYVFADGEHFLFAFGAKGGAEGKMSRPRALAIDEVKRCVYVVDYMRHTVLIFDFSGTFRFEFGGRGWGPGWFNYPVDITLGRQGQVIVADFFNQRAQVFEVTLPVFPERPSELWHVQAKDGK